MSNPIKIVIFIRFQSSEVLKMQLQNALTVMTITRSKLIKYLAVFRKHIPGDSLHELHQTINGIEEVKSILNENFWIFCIFIKFLFLFIL